MKKSDTGAVLVTNKHFTRNISPTFPRTTAMFTALPSATASENTTVLLNRLLNLTQVIITTSKAMTQNYIKSSPSMLSTTFT